VFEESGGAIQGVTESQIDRIKKAEEATKGFFDFAAEIRREAETMEDAEIRKEFLEIADGFEAQAQELLTALRKWREDIH